MSEFKTRNLTNQGLDLIASVLADKSNALEFTKIQLGSGTYEGDTAEATSLIELRHTLQINKIERKGSNVILNASLIAKELKDSFYWKEIGVWAKGSDGKEILYLYSYTNKASYISAEMQNERLIQLIVMVGNVENVTVTIDNSLVYLTKADLEPMLDELRDKDKELQKEIDDLALQIGNIRLDWDSIEGKPEKFPPEKHPHKWDEIEEKPSSYPPETHYHNQYQEVLNKNLNPFNIDTTRGNWVCGITAECQGTKPADGWFNIYQSDCSHFLTQLAIECNGYRVYTRSKYTSSGSTWTAWQYVFTSQNKPTCSDIGAAIVGHGHNNATQSASGMMSPSDKTKLDNIAANANNYVLPAASSTTRGGVKVGYTTSGKNYAVQLSNEKMYVNVPWTDTNTTYSNATQSTSGLMSNTDKTKLDGIAQGANKTTINNTFTSASTTEALSAARGKELKELTDGKLAKSGGDVTGNTKFYSGSGFVEPSGSYILKAMQGQDSPNSHGLFCSVRYGTNDAKAIKVSSMWNNGINERELFWVGGAGTVWADNLTVANSITVNGINLLNEINGLKSTVVNGKTLVANAINDRFKTSLNNQHTFQELADAITNGNFLKTDLDFGNMVIGNSSTYVDNVKAIVGFAGSTSNSSSTSVDFCSDVSDDVEYMIITVGSSYGTRGAGVMKNRRCTKGGSIYASIYYSGSYQDIVVNGFTGSPPTCICILSKPVRLRVSSGSIAIT